MTQLNANQRGATRRVIRFAPHLGIGAAAQMRNTYRIIQPN